MACAEPEWTAELQAFRQAVPDVETFCAKWDWLTDVLQGEGHGWHVRTAALKDLFYWYGGLRREQERPWLWGLLLHPQRLDQVVVLVARCLEEAFSNAAASTLPQLGGPSYDPRACKYAVHSLCNMAQVEGLAGRLGDAALCAVLRALTGCLAAGSRISQLPDGEALLRVANVVLMTLLGGADRTRIIGAVLGLLDPEPSPRFAYDEVDSGCGGSVATTWNAVAVKQLIVVTKSLPSHISAMHVPGALAHIHRYMQDLGREELRRPSQRGDRSTRAVKTLLFELCRLRRSAILTDLRQMPGVTERPNQMVMLPYIHLNLKAVYRTGTDAGADQGSLAAEQPPEPRCPAGAPPHVTAQQPPKQRPTPGSAATGGRHAPDLALPAAPPPATSQARAVNAAAALAVTPPGTPVDEGDALPGTPPLSPSRCGSRPGQHRADTQLPAARTPGNTAPAAPPSAATRGSKAAPLSKTRSASVSQPSRPRTGAPAPKAATPKPTAPPYRDSVAAAAAGGSRVPKPSATVAQAGAHAVTVSASPALQGTGGTQPIPREAGRGNDGSTARVPACSGLRMATRQPTAAKTGPRAARTTTAAQAQAQAPLLGGDDALDGGDGAAAVVAVKQRQSAARDAGEVQGRSPEPGGSGKGALPYTALARKQECWAAGKLGAGAASTPVTGAPPDSSKEGQLAAVGQQQQQQQQQERPPPPPPPPQQQQQLSPRPSPCTPAGSRLRGAAGDLDDLRNRMDCLTATLGALKLRSRTDSGSGQAA